MRPATGSLALDGRCVLVTGGSRGIGASLAVGLAAAGASVAVVARTMAGLERTTSTISASGGRAVPICADLETACAEALVSEASERLGGLHVLVNNAATDADAAAADVTLDVWRRVQRLNVEVPLALSQAVYARFRRAGGGKIINVTSTMSLVGGRGKSAYIASKHALLGLTRATALEWARDNVQVNALAPGAVETDLLESEDNEAFRAWLLKRTPAGRLAQPDDLVGATVFLASTASDFVTGQSIVVDGGWTTQ